VSQPGVDKRGRVGYISAAAGSKALRKQIALDLYPIRRLDSPSAFSLGEGV